MHESASIERSDVFGDTELNITICNRWMWVLLTFATVDDATAKVTDSFK